MENAMVRPRYTRKPMQNRRHRKIQPAGGGLKRIIARQFAICILLLILVFIVKSINFPAANSATEKIKYMISYNVELKNIFDDMGKLATQIRDSITSVASGKPAVSENQAKDSALSSSMTQTQTSPSALTSSKIQTPTTDQAGDTVQTSHTAQASAIPPSSGESQVSSISKESEGNTATLSSVISMPKEGVTQSMEDKTMDASSSIENASDQDSASEESDTQEETSVLSASMETGRQNTFDMIIPVEGTLISAFGEKSTDAAGNSKSHKGIDIKVDKGDSIRSVLDGKVSETGSSPAYGSYIRIMHANGLQTIYANCSSILVKKGDIVKKGDAIAKIGGTGAASVGFHLHFEIWKDGVAVDPSEYVIVPAR